MPTFRHNLVIELFRNSGELARELLCELIDLPGGELIAEVLSADFSELVPTEYRADHVTAYHRKRRRGGPPAFAIIVEVQHKIDKRKRWSWLAYVANAAARFKCPVLLLVATWKPRVAAWARGPFPAGQPGFDLRPFAIDLSKLPTLHSAAMAPRIPELAVLCALAHPNAASAKAAIASLRGLPFDRADLYSKSIASALSKSEALTLEKQMLEAPDVDYFKIFPNLCEHLKQRFLNDGREDGRKEGVVAMQDVALKTIRSKLRRVPPDEQAAIRGLQDVEVLTTLLVELGAAEGAKQVSAAIARALKGRAGRRLGRPKQKPATKPRGRRAPGRRGTPRR